MTYEAKRIVDGMREGNFTHLADLIESLAAELEQVKREREELAEKCRQLEARNDTLIAKEVLFDEAIAAGAKMQRERDAAVEDVAKLKRCEHCIGYEEFLKPDGNIERCNECEERSHWQWRGVKED